jgi:protocatechuate 3,4-dioxygenase, beta subunit
LQLVNKEICKKHTAMTAKANFISVAFLLALLLSCNGQSKKNPAIPTTNNNTVGGTFENSAFTYYGIPKMISAIDTSPGWHQKGQKLLITGTVYQPDGKTPAPNVLIYYYHTNIEGRYVHKPNEKRSMPPNQLGQTHGYIRGWVKTDTTGSYAIYTVRPGTYPTRDEPDHIHVTIKEPNDINEYYIDDFIFDDDILLTGEKRKRLQNRGGSGVLKLLAKDDLQIAEHNIVLGLNIPNYPAAIKDALQSGLQIGEDQPSFIPFHAFGPDKGTRTCPVCKYGRYHGIVYFVGATANWDEIKNWLKYLDTESIKRQQYLKAYFVYGNPTNYNKQARQNELEKIGVELGLQKIALTFVPSFADTESEANLNKINAAAENTFIVYRHRTIIDKFINLKPTTQNFRLISTMLDNTKGNYFDIESINTKH